MRIVIAAYKLHNSLYRYIFDNIFLIVNRFPRAIREIFPPQNSEALRRRRSALLILIESNAILFGGCHDTDPIVIQELQTRRVKISKLRYRRCSRWLNYSYIQTTAAAR